MPALALFPLPTVLFPGNAMPLHIVEPRYRCLLADCVAGDRRVGVIYRPPGSGERVPPRGHVGCVAEIAESHLLADGRANVIVRGGARFALERIMDARGAPYHIAEVCHYDDLPESADATASAAARVRALFERVARAAHAIADVHHVIPDLPTEPGLLSFAVAGRSDLDADARQSLLASRSAAERLSVLETLYANAAGGYERRADVHTRAKGNGQGRGAPPF